MAAVRVEQVERAPVFGRNGDVGVHEPGKPRAAPPDPVVGGICDEERTVCRDRDVLREGELRLERRPVIALVTGGARARRASDEPIRRDLADDVMETVGEIDRAVGGGCDALRLADLRGRCSAAVAGRAGLTVPGQRRDLAAGRDRPNAVVKAVGDVEDALGVDRHVIGMVELCELA